MRRLCPNIDREDGLETVLEVPIPEEMFTSMGSNVTIRWENMQAWMKAQTNNKWSSSPIIAGRFNELRFLLYLIGSPLIPLQVQLGHSIHRPVKDCSIVRTIFIIYITTPYIYSITLSCSLLKEKNWFLIFYTGILEWSSL